MSALARLRSSGVFAAWAVDVFCFFGVNLVLVLGILRVFGAGEGAAVPDVEGVGSPSKTACSGKKGRREA